MPDIETPVLIPANKVRRRYTVSDMWLYRRLGDDPTFPRPLRINGRRYWYISELERWELSCRSGEAA
jgi:predicted DNA-binding transcriptional regulator AlpA